MHGPIILIEGLDLAGKSTLFHRLLSELRRKRMPTRSSRNALCPENPIAHLADGLRRDPAASMVETGSLFLASHCWDARHFRMPPPGTIHLQDSSWLRTLSFHTHHGTPAIPSLLRAASASFPKFDAAIFLTASITRRRQRLVQREAQHPGANDWQDHLVARAPSEFRALEDCLRSLSVELAGAVVLDTSEFPPDVVLTTAWHHLASAIPEASA
jgi:hypothetical protein